jgi:hypothetical protein
VNLGRNLPAGSGYRVTIHTCDVADAGTDARIQLQLTGDGGTGSLVELKTASSDPFERASSTPTSSAPPIWGTCGSPGS